MKTNWDLTVFYKDFDDPAFKADLGGLDASIAALTEAVGTNAATDERTKRSERIRVDFFIKIPPFKKNTISSIHKFHAILSIVH